MQDLHMGDLQLTDGQQSVVLDWTTALNFLKALRTVKTQDCIV